jgi:hypothetical protein
MDSARKIPLPLYSYRKHAESPDSENPNFEQNRGFGNIVPRPRAQVYGELPGYQAPQFLARSHTPNPQRQALLGRNKNKRDGDVENNEPENSPSKIVQESTNEELDKSSGQSSNLEIKALANQDNPNNALNSEHRNEEDTLESDLKILSDDAHELRVGAPTARAFVVPSNNPYTKRKERKNDPKRAQFRSDSKLPKKKAAEHEKSIAFFANKLTPARELLRVRMEEGKCRTIFDDIASYIAHHKPDSKHDDSNEQGNNSLTKALTPTLVNLFPSNATASGFKDYCSAVHTFLKEHPLDCPFELHSAGKDIFATGPTILRKLPIAAEAVLTTAIEQPEKMGTMWIELAGLAQNIDEVKFGAELFKNKEFLDSIDKKQRSELKQFGKKLQILYKELVEPMGPYQTLLGLGPTATELKKLALIRKNLPASMILDANNGNLTGISSMRHHPEYPEGPGDYFAGKPSDFQGIFRENAKLNMNRKNQEVANIAGHDFVLQANNDFWRLNYEFVFENGEQFRSTDIAAKDQIPRNEAVAGALVKFAGSPHAAFVLSSLLLQGPLSLIVLSLGNADKKPLHHLRPINSMNTAKRLDATAMGREQPPFTIFKSDGTRELIDTQGYGAAKFKLSRQGDDFKLSIGWQSYYDLKYDEHDVRSDALPLKEGDVIGARFDIDIIINGPLAGQRMLELSTEGIEAKFSGRLTMN